MKETLMDDYRHQIRALLTFEMFSPLVYGIIVALLPAAGRTSPLATSLKDIFLVIAVALVAGAHVIGFVALGRCRAKRMSPRGLRGACLLIGGMGESICLLGLGLVLLGLDKSVYLPFLAVAAIFFIDFRIFRVPALLDCLTEPDDKTKNQ